MKRTLIFPGVVLFLFLLLSCGVTNPDPRPGSGKGKVALFISDNISFYQQVVSTITGVRLIDSGTGEVCRVLASPVTYDISNLTNMAQYAHVAECPEGRYNRVDIEVKRDVLVMDQLGQSSACAYTSFFDEAGRTQTLACDQGTGICTLSIRGGSRDSFLRVQEDRYNDLGIDFDLKKFSIADFGNPSSCSVTMAVSLKSAADMNQSGRSHGVTGSISNLGTDTDTFTLTSSGLSLTVRYADVLPSLQPGIDGLLLFAQAEGLRVNVLTGDIDLASGTISADRIFVKASGTVSNVQSQPAWSFVLRYQPDQDVDVSFKPPATVQGTLAEDVWVNVKFGGYDDKNGKYLASSIEILPSGTVLDD